MAGAVCWRWGEVGEVWCWRRPAGMRSAAQGARRKAACATLQARTRDRRTQRSAARSFLHTQHDPAHPRGSWKSAALLCIRITAHDRAAAGSTREAAADCVSSGFAAACDAMQLDLSVLAELIVSYKRQFDDLGDDDRVSSAVVGLRERGAALGAPRTQRAPRRRGSVAAPHFENTQRVCFTSQQLYAKLYGSTTLLAIKITYCCCSLLPAAAAAAAISCCRCLHAALCARQSRRWHSAPQ